MSFVEFSGDEDQEIYFEVSIESESPDCVTFRIATRGQIDQILTMNFEELAQLKSLQETLGTEGLLDTFTTLFLSTWIKNQDQKDDDGPWNEDYIYQPDEPSDPDW